MRTIRRSPLVAVAVVVGAVFTSAPASGPIGFRRRQDPDRLSSDGVERT